MGYAAYQAMLKRRETINLAFDLQKDNMPNEKERPASTFNARCRLTPLVTMLGLATLFCTSTSVAQDWKQIGKQIKQQVQAHTQSPANQPSQPPTDAPPSANQSTQARPPQIPPRDPNRTDLFVCSYATDYQLGPKAVFRRTDVFRAETTVDEVRRAWSALPENAPNAGGNLHLVRPNCGEVGLTQNPQQLYAGMEAAWRERGGKILHDNWTYGGVAPVVSSPQNAPQPAPSADGTAYMFCFSGGVNNTMYYTDIFPLTLQQRRQGDAAQDAHIGSAFYAYLANKKLAPPNSSGQAQCEIRSTEQAAIAYKQQCQGNPNDRKVETHWTGTGSALQASGPHKDAAGFMFCRARGRAPNTDYFAGVLPTSVQINPQRPDMDGVYMEGGEAFYHYLTSQGLADDIAHPGSRQAECYVSPREEQAAKEMQDAEQRLTAINGRVIKINWTYK